jgi:two-component system sensor histidine kinase FlrB
MLPSSHPVLINGPLAASESASLDCGEIENLIDRSLHSRNESKDESEVDAGNATLLASAFSEFILASSRLEKSYRLLQQEVYELGQELSHRNAALKISLADNERMRLALEQIVDSMPCGVLVVDRDGEISMINPESGRLLGVDWAHLGEGSHTTLRQISNLSGVNLESCYAGASSSDTGQEFCVHDASGKRWLEIRNRRLFHKVGRSEKPDQTILILRDVTTQKRAELERESGRKAMALAEITTVLAH